MDPITGIGLAASVIQLVSFGIDAAKTCREIYENGVLDDHSQVDYYAAQLSTLTMSIRQSLQNSNTQSLVLSPEETELVDLSQRCQGCALQLQQEIQKLGVQTKPRSSIVLAASKAARALWKKNSIERIQKQLENYRSTLEISLLSRLSQRFDAQGLKSGESFASLDKSLQHIIACLANSETTLATISVQEAEQTRQHTAAQIGCLGKLYIDDRRFEEVMRSLFYPEIFSRQEQIANVFDGIESSYDWIFDKPRIREIDASDQVNSPPPAPLWDDFAYWLKSGHGVYWINGKAGSGKSTLMNHICGHNRRLELLQEWSSHRRLLTPSFFFWNSGSRQQKTIDGLLRSLIYQMLKECRQLITCFEDTPIHAWTENHLLTVLFNFLRHTQFKVAICMFIDGLDEFDGRYKNVIKMITDVSDQEHVKICVSSRPLLAFERAFSANPRLRLQDLTFDSITKYIMLQLSDSVEQNVPDNAESQHSVESLLETIVERAEGVFLWVVLAVREIRDGLEGKADLNDLARSIEALPPELESLFMLVLGRIKPVFQRDAANLLRIVLLVGSYPDLDLFRLYLIHSQQELQDAPFVYETIAKSELAEACRTLNIRLLSHTAGLLELTPCVSAPLRYRKRGNWDSIVFTKVGFSHRTVRDLLRDNNEAKSFLNDFGLSEAQVHLCIARGTLAHLVQYAEGDAVMLEEREVRWPHPMLYPFKHVLEHVAIAERLFGRAQTKLIQSLDYASLVRGCSNTTGPYTIFQGPYQAFSKNGAGTLIDVVGMAAAAGMTIYVCERLGLLVSSAGYDPCLPDHDEYSKIRAAPAYLDWETLDQLQDTAPRGHTLFRDPTYRQSLSKCLQWGEDARVEDEQTGIYPVAESFILCCCEPTSIDLVWTLLKAGANPMVEVRPMDPKFFFRRNLNSFWSAWLSFLNGMRLEYMNAHGKSGGMLLRERLDRHTLSDIFKVTKALLLQGADVNIQLERYASFGSARFHKRRDLDNLCSHVTLSATGMFILEECFTNEPEFQEFAVAISPLIKRPIREIARISVRGDIDGDGEEDTRVGRVVSPDVSMVLWPLFEKWERTGHHKDLTALETAADQVYYARRPWYKRKEESKEEAEDESKEELEEESGEESEEESEEEYEAELEEEAIV